MQFRNQKFEKIKQQIEIYKEKKLLWEQDLQERKNQEQNFRSRNHHHLTEDATV